MEHKDLSYYLQLEYPTTIRKMPDPEPTVRLEIPVGVFEQLARKEELAAYIQYT